MAASAPALQRLSVAAAMPYATLERMTRPLILANRWPSRSRRDLQASDLGSLLNAILGGQANEASAEVDDMLRRLEYVSTWTPAGAVVAEPSLGFKTWGETLDTLIEVDLPSHWIGVDQSYVTGRESPLPRIIEACVNPLSLSVIWLGQDGLRNRVDYYQPTFEDRVKQRLPYGEARLLARRSFMDVEMIMLAGEILRDISPATRTSQPPLATEIPGGSSEVESEEGAGEIPASPATPSDRSASRKEHLHKRANRAPPSSEATLAVRVSPTEPAVGPPKAGHPPQRSRNGQHRRS